MQFLEIQYYLVIVIAAQALLIAVLNLRFLDSLQDSDSPDDQHPNCLVSVLVPARNEEENIRQCLQALIGQNHESIEILILDDWSTDRTAEVIQEFAKLDSRVRMFKGAELPSGWTGKNWASHQLSQEAIGDHLLFINADTILSEGTVSAAVTNSVNRAVDLLTVMPRRTVSCITEELIYPFIDWAVFCWMPMKIAHESGNPHLSATFGPFMLFKREAYEAIGGYESIRSNSLDDFELGRNIKRRGLKWMLFEGVNSVRVLAYKGNIDAFKGVSRSVVPALYYRVSAFLLLSMVVLGLGFLPLLTFAVGAISYPHEMEFLFVGTGLIIIVAIPWLIVCQKFKHNLLIVPFYPLSIALMVAVGLHSIVMYSFGQVHWKDRRIVGRRIRF